MLSPEEKKEIDKELATLPYKRAACIGAMKTVQKYRGWLDREGLHDVAEYLEMSPHELDSVASFYNLIFQHPVGKNVIFVCDSISCWVEGYPGIMKYIQDKLQIKPGETTSDGNFTLLTIPCLGLCDKAPAMIIGKESYGSLSEEKVDRILEKYKNE